MRAEPNPIMTAISRATTGRPVAPWIYLAVLAATSVVARLPQLLSPNLLLEGDECILGLMGLHLAKGREFPIFFYGQRYGLSIVEAPAAALSFLTLGVGAVPLKLAMLAVWIVGVFFYFLAFSRPLGAPRAFWITLTLAVMPAWAASSMKAWSGYITAFTATAVVIYLITRNDNRRSFPWLLAGAVSSLIYFAHPLWLPGLVPIVLYFLAASRRRSFWLFYAAGIAGVAGAVIAVKIFWLAAAVETWTGPTAGNPHLLASLPRLVTQAYVDLTGSFYFGNAVYIGPVTAATVYLWMAILAAAVLVQIYRLVTRKYLLWSHLLFASVFLTLVSNWVLLDWRDARYVLAMNVPLVFMAGVEFFDLVDRHHVPVQRRVLAILLVCALEAISMTEFSRYSYMWWTNSPTSPSEGKTMERVVGHLRARGVTHVFAMNALLQWPITFYSRETVLARWKARSDRYPAYIRKVDRALDNGETVAIVGYVGYTNGLEALVRDPERIIKVDGKYFIYIGPDKDLLRKLGFQLR